MIGFIDVLSYCTNIATPEVEKQWRLYTV